MADCDVLIAGAGPTGLVLALWLNRLGVKVRIIDKADQAATTSRALAVQVRTLELYDQLGPDRCCHRSGAIRRPAITCGSAASRWPTSHSAISAMARAPRPSSSSIPRTGTSSFSLIDTAEAVGVVVERPVELAHFIQDARGVTARLRDAKGHEETCRAAYLAGCDGAHSVVRHGIERHLPRAEPITGCSMSPMSRPKGRPSMAN